MPRTHFNNPFRSAIIEMSSEKAAVAFCFLFLFFLSTDGARAAASVVIREVMFDPQGASDTGLERIVLQNKSSGVLDVSGWQVYPDGIGYFSFPAGFTLSSGAPVMLHLRTSGITTARDMFYPGASGNMGNTSGSVAVFSREPRGKDTIQSFVQWGRAGQTWESAAADAGLWTKGDFVDLAGFTEGHVIEVRAGSAESLGQWLRVEQARWAKVVKDSGAKFD